MAAKLLNVQTRVFLVAKIKGNTVNADYLQDAKRSQNKVSTVFHLGQTNRE